MLTTFDVGSPLSYTHRDAFARELARKRSGVNFYFLKKLFLVARAPNRTDSRPTPHVRNASHIDGMGKLQTPHRRPLPRWMVRTYEGDGVQLLPF